MGLAASQAQLLSITSRMSDNELRAQLVSNEKMRLAAESGQVSEKYVQALNDAHLVFTNYGPDKTSQTQALNFNVLTAYNQYNNQYGLSNLSGQILVSEADADKFQRAILASDPLKTFLESQGLKYETNYFGVDGIDTSSNWNNATQQYIMIQEAEGKPMISSNYTAAELKKIYMGYDGHMGYQNTLQSPEWNTYVGLMKNYEDTYAAYHKEMTAFVAEVATNNETTVANSKVNMEPVLRYFFSKSIYNETDPYKFNGNTSGEGADSLYTILNNDLRNKIRLLGQYAKEGDTFFSTQEGLISNQNPYEFQPIDNAYAGVSDNFLNATVLTPAVPANPNANPPAAAVPATYKYDNKGKEYSIDLGDGCTFVITMGNTIGEKSCKIVGADRKDYPFSGRPKNEETITIGRTSDTGGSNVSAAQVTYKGLDAIYDSIDVRENITEAQKANHDDSLKTAAAALQSKTVYSTDPDTYNKQDREAYTATLNQLIKEAGAHLDMEGIYLMAYMMDYNVDNIDTFDYTTNYTQQYKYVPDSTKPTDKKRILNDKLEEKHDAFVEAVAALHSFLVSSHPQSYYGSTNSDPTVNKWIGKTMTDVFSNNDSDSTTPVDINRTGTPGNADILKGIEFTKFRSMSFIYDKYEYLIDMTRPGMAETNLMPVYDLLLLESVFATYGEPVLAWVDQQNPLENGNKKAEWYTNLFNRMCDGYQVLEDGLAASKEWIKYAFESGLVVMEQVDDNRQWNDFMYTSCVDISEKTDTSAVALAEAEYKRAMNKIETKDKRYDMELKNIDTEHTSLQNEYDSIKTAIDKNIERTFKIYSA